MAALPSISRVESFLLALILLYKSCEVVQCERVQGGLR